MTLTILISKKTWHWYELQVHQTKSSIQKVKYNRNNKFQIHENSIQYSKSKAVSALRKGRRAIKKKWFNKTKKSNSNENQIKTKASIKSQDFHLCLEQTQMQLSRNGIWGILLKIWSYCLISLMDCSNCTLNISKFHDKPNIFTCKSVPLLSSDR